eukprot:XP_011414778.1 PREDICTED: uncharacterized protein LOC105319071 [Crassostrea gigas]
MDLLLALISLVMTSSGLEAFETHRRICHSNEVDVGIRKASWEPVAIHTCVLGPRTHECFAIVGTDGFNCTGDFHLQGGLPHQRSMCCNRLNHQLVGCTLPLRSFSFQRGFDIQLGTKVIRSIKPSPTQNDITAFRVEICSLFPPAYDPFLKK